MPVSLKSAFKALEGKDVSSMSPWDLLKVSGIAEPTVWQILAKESVGSAHKSWAGRSTKVESNLLPTHFQNLLRSWDESVEDLKVFSDPEKLRSFRYTPGMGKKGWLQFLEVLDRLGIVDYWKL